MRGACVVWNSWQVCELVVPVSELLQPADYGGILSNGLPGVTVDDGVVVSVMWYETYGWRAQWKRWGIARRGAPLGTPPSRMRSRIERGALRCQVS